MFNIQIYICCYFKDYLKQRNADEDVLDVEINRFKESRKQKNEEDNDVKEALKKIRSQPKNDVSFDNNSDASDSESDISMTGRGRGTRGARGQGKGRGRGGGDGETTRGGKGSRGGGRGSRGKKQSVLADKGLKSVADVFASSGMSSSSSRPRKLTSKYK